MKSMKNLKYILILLSLNIFGQTLYNNGAQISINDGGILSVMGDVQNNTGTLQNNGDITVQGSITNNDDLRGVGVNAQYQLTGDWINNASFTAGQSTVLMNGQNQLISGSQESTFYNLVLGGTGIKSQGINAFVENELNLNDIELATEVYNMYLQNPSVNALLLNMGFVSSQENGAFYRATNSQATYLFPTGSSINAAKYRPIEITPNSPIEQEYGIRLVNNDPDLNGYDREAIESDVLCTVNPEFYHYIYHTKGTAAADLSFYFDEFTDMAWNRVGHWKSGAWRDTDEPSLGSGYGLSSLNIPAWTDFDSRAFALASERPYLYAGDDVEIKLGQTVWLNAEYDASNGGVPRWNETPFLSCLDCLDPEASPVQTMDFGIELTDNFGCTVGDEMRVFINGILILMPTGFTPNFDGLNDDFKPLNKIFDELSIKIFNRWGQQVYQSDDLNGAWDGTFNGKQQEAGVYIYDMSFSFIGEERTRFYKGNVTLLR